MSSSSTSLSRTRSLQKPTAGSNGSTRGNAPAARNDARNTSPSRLPVKPTMTTRSMASNNAAAAPSTTTTARRTASSTITGRPTSGIYSKGPSTRSDNAAGNTAAKAPRPLGRAASTRQASSSSTAAAAGSIPSTRSASTTVSRPRSSGGPPPTASNRPIGHSRSKSTVTSLTAATTLRPAATQSRISQTSSTSSGRTSPAASTVTTASSKAPTRQTRSQTHTRAKSQSNPIAPSQQQQQQQQPSQSRPAFNTHQQHYSPAKSLAPKPLTSTFLAPPSPSKLPANVAISAETSRLQTELLQLSLLHRDAAAVDSEWRSSAREKLGARFARLVADNEALVKLERHGVEARNIAALVRWGKSSSGNSNSNGRSGLGLEEKIQILDEVLNGVWQLGEPGGRYQRVVASFEAWAERMASIISAQRSGDVDGLIAGGEVRFLGDLDRTWARDCESLLRKLEGWRAALRDLGDVDGHDSYDSRDPALPDSGLARMVGGARALVQDMLAELKVMGEIERDAARTENEWITRMNKAIEDEDDDTPAARAYVPLWKLAV
ncbi:hypothetical protein Daesc_005181 [Daldinia eschscholtzii]|uniref:AGA1 A-agglutinin anchor subunit n=1 Tax=Daldinia eschscholtzii TaxID=292717 RepID=A0AAX6MK67_9PEZI